MPDDGPWTKYAKPEASSGGDGPWSKYAGGGTAVAEHPEEPEPTLGQQVMSTAKDVGTGALKGLMHTGTALSPLLNKIPYIGETLAPSAGIKAAEEMSKPEGMAQKIGFGGEQAAEFLLPAGVEEKAGAAAARLLGKSAAPLGRIAGGALTSGAINKLQGGDFGTGAVMGAGSGAVGEAARAVAPKVAESALGITQRMRGRGRTIGEAVLDETKGIRPETVMKSAGDRIGSLTDTMESGVHDATQMGKAGTTLPAHMIIQDAVSKVPRNAQGLRAKLTSLQDILSLGGPARTIHSPDELLEMKRGIGKEMATWPPEWQRMPDVKAVQARLYGAIDKQLDMLSPENAGLNQKISSLIPAKKAAQKQTMAAPLAQKLTGRMAAHTGALMGAGIGGSAGYHEGGVPGAIAGTAAGLVLPEVLAGPSSQMLAARTMRSGLPGKAVRAGSSRLMGRKDDSE